MNKEPVTIMSFSVTRKFFAGVCAALALIVGITFGVMNLPDSIEPRVPRGDVPLQIPGESELTSDYDICYESPVVSLVSYTVEPGDTLTEISKQFGTTVSSIVAINGLTSPDKLSAGQNLMIMQNASGTIRRVNGGDTLSDICRTYGVSIDTIMEVNDISDPDHLTPGQLLLLPGAPTTPGSAQIASGSRATSFLWPVTGKVTSGFGERIHPITGLLQFHEGIDIASSHGTPVRAAAGGTVTFTGSSGGYGNLLTISHANSFATRYAHLSKIVVFKGDTVTAGDIIGYVGNTGDTTGPHLHFEVLCSNAPKNPRDYLP